MLEADIVPICDLYCILYTELLKSKFESEELPNNFGSELNYRIGFTFQVFHTITSNSVILLLVMISYFWGVCTTKKKNTCSYEILEQKNEHLKQGLIFLLFFFVIY